LKRKLKNVDEEIHFFKQLKPRIVSILTYYNAIYKIETRKAFGGEETVRAYLDNELLRLKRFFDNNLEFYEYILMEVCKCRIS
jgi:hypothetical protein